MAGRHGIALALSERTNLAQQTRERWRPPALAAAPTAASRWGAKLRRFFDLQAGTCWNDVAELVADSKGKVVDVGCGGQPYRVLFPKGVEYVGIDIADAATNFGYDTSGTVYFDGGEWPQQAANADLVLCTEVLEHVASPAKFLEQAHRSLRPGGSLVGTVPFAARWHFIPFDYWRFTPSGLKQLLEEAGFENVQVWARGNALTVACYKSMALFLPLLMPQGKGSLGTWFMRLLGAPLAPAFVLLALLAAASLKMDGGDDCLGYSVLAQRSC